MTRAVILASKSPRRREMLETIGFDVTVRIPAVPEVRESGESIEAFLERVAYDKARAVQRGDDAAPVVAGDTVVVADGTAIGKPADAEDARRILAELSGTQHEVWSGWCVLRGDDRRGGVEKTKVRLRTLTAIEIDAYVETGEPLDKAGAYGIQGRGAALVETVDGNYPNVVGLPLTQVLAAIRAG